MCHVSFLRALHLDWWWWRLSGPQCESEAPANRHWADVIVSGEVRMCAISTPDRTPPAPFLQRQLLVSLPDRREEKRKKVLKRSFDIILGKAALPS